MKAKAVIEKWDDGSFGAYADDDVFGIMFYAVGKTQDEAKRSFVQLYEELCEEGDAVKGLDIQFANA